MTKAIGLIQVGGTEIASRIDISTYHEKQLCKMVLSYIVQHLPSTAVLLVVEYTPAVEFVSIRHDGVT